MASPYLYWGELSMAHQLAEKGITISEQLQFTEWLPMAHATDPMPETQALYAELAG